MRRTGVNGPSIRSSGSRRLAWGRGALLAAALLALAPSGAGHAAPRQDPSGKALIYAGWYGNTIPTPSFVANNFAFLESQPFNGLVMYLRNPSLTVNASFNVMNANPISYSSIASVLDPVRDLEFQQLRENFAYVLCNDPPDYFDDWSVTVQNFANLARALREGGLKGIFFDNEQYITPCFDYPGGVSYPQYTLAQYQDQARLRGRQVMQAMVAEFPDIVALTLHGPYISEPDAPWQLGFPSVVNDNALMGPFFAGFHEGRGDQALNVDGGEIYWLNSATEFAVNAEWRRFDLGSDQVDCAFIEGETRETWSDTISIGFGVYDAPWDPASLTTTLTNALDAADKYVWLYAETMTFLLPPSQGGASSTWVSAVRAALPETTIPAEDDPPTSPPPPPSPSFSPAASSEGETASRCGLLGIEVVPIFLALGWARSRRKSKR